ncbi:uncharacterized protein DUF4397 [Chitinophaga dinghuensis]|uniref:Uncharacterized protein DUF4397 n=1 Tax=Chitinophaga dinghuensis TaxID=1539050 RepID=A0A327WCH3_9BACT|nr:DUF4397 domain-containing protein [Chitinophaga dinghuensis]RAJ87582.1 uncharacterized protein DUF4397 [Chitinophaga dinghuensis]
MKQILTVLFLGVLAFAACKKDVDSAIPVTQSHFMFINGVPGSSFGVRVDTVNVSNGVPYGQGSAYASFRAQAYNLYIYPVNNPSNVINLGQVNLRNGRYFSGILGVDSTNTGLVFAFTEDDLSALPGKSARYRVVDLSDSYRSTRNTKVPLGLDFAVDTSIILNGFAGMGFTAQSSFKTIYADSSYKLNVFWADSSKRLGVFPMNLNNGKVYTFVATGNALDTVNFNVFPVLHN